MNLEKLTSLFQRALFAGSLLIMAVAVLERVANSFGYTMMPQNPYSSGRMLEFAAIFLIVVIALLLRQVRDVLKHASR